MIDPFEHIINLQEHVKKFEDIKEDKSQLISGPPREKAIVNAIKILAYLHREDTPLLISEKNIYVTPHKSISITIKGARYDLIIEMIDGGIKYTIPEMGRYFPSDQNAFSNLEKTAHKLDTAINEFKRINNIVS